MVRHDAVIGAAGDVERVSALDSTAPESEAVYRLQVGRRLRLHRVGLGLSQQEAADAGGTTRNFVSATERGAQGLDAWRLRCLAAGLGTSLAWLLGIDPQDVGPGGFGHRP